MIIICQNHLVDLTAILKIHKNINDEKQLKISIIEEKKI